MWWRRFKQTDWYSWFVVGVTIIFGTLVFLALEGGIIGNAIDQYYSIGKYRR